MMGQVMDDADLAQAVVRSFLADIPRQVAALHAALDADDAAVAQRVAHTLKGAAATIGGVTVRALALEMEQAAEQGGIDAVRARVDELEHALEALRRELTAWQR